VSIDELIVMNLFKYLKNPGMILLSIRTFTLMYNLHILDLDNIFEILRNSNHCRENDDNVDTIARIT